MRIHCLRHVPFEGPARIETWARDAGHPFTLTDLWRQALPPVEQVDLLVVMGGPMSVHDESQFPFLAAEKRWIAAAIEAGRAVLGICLGAQLLADALGARVYRGAEPEIGWFPVSRAAAEASVLDGVPERFVPLHWHGDTFDLPAGAQLLASSEAYPNQAFQWGPRVIALQFHIEVTPASVGEFVRYCGAGIGTGRWQQPAAAILEQAEHHPVRLASVLDSVLGRVAESIPARGV